MSRIIGCQSLYFAKVTTDTTSGTTFETPFPVPALVAVDVKDNSDSVTLFSDDVTEQVINTFSGKEVTIELGYLSNELEAKLTGQKYENGMLIQEANPVSSEFAMMFKAPKSRGGFQYVVLYKGTISRTDSAYKTKEDSIEGQTVSLTGVFMPLLSNNRVAAKADSDDTSASTLIATWFTKVPLNTATRETEAKASVK